MLGVIVKAIPAGNKQYIILMLKPEISSMQTPLASGSSQDNKSSDFPQGYMLMPKSKRALEEEYCSSMASRKGSGVINIKLPYHGAAAGVHYEVRVVDTGELLFICKSKIKIDQVRLLEDGSSIAYSKTVQQLLDTKSDGNKYPPALDPLKGVMSS